MPRPPDTRRRTELLEALIDAFATGGIGGRSLREVAEAVGTSHRMLLHHFGSRDELLLAIVEEVERRQAETLAVLPKNPADAFAAS
ncbi:MAG: TetR/AcrR family transcriptional regulator, partial [Ilumatobacteraceae bacterium]